MFDFRKYETTEKFDEYLSEEGTEDKPKNLLLIDIGRSINEMEDRILHPIYSDEDIEKAFKKGLKLGLWEELEGGTIRSIRFNTEHKHISIPSNVDVLDFWNYETTLKPITSRFSPLESRIYAGIHINEEGYWGSFDDYSKELSKKDILSAVNNLLNKGYIKYVKYDPEIFLDKIEAYGDVVPEAIKVLRNYIKISRGEYISEKELDDDLEFLINRIGYWLEDENFKGYNGIREREKPFSSDNQLEIKRYYDTLIMEGFPKTYNDKILTLDRLINIMHNSGAMLDENIIRHGAPKVNKLLDILRYN